MGPLMLSFVSFPSLRTRSHAFSRPRLRLSNIAARTVTRPRACDSDGSHMGGTTLQRADARHVMMGSRMPVTKDLTLGGRLLLSHACCLRSVSPARLQLRRHDNGRAFAPKGSPGNLKHWGEVAVGLTAVAGCGRRSGSMANPHYT